MRDVVSNNYYVDGVYDRTETTYSNPVTMLHCDFGWEGYCNGYYVSGIFDVDDDRVEFDPSRYEYTEDTEINYNWYLKIIKYDNPNE